jgi:tetratricopeptide (TPR) repeat protein
MKTFLFGIFSFFLSTFIFSQQHQDRHLHKGIEAYNNQEEEKALKHFEKEILHNPNEAQAYYYIGLIKDSRGLNDGCDYFSKAIELNPNYHEAYNNRSNCKSYQGDKQGALEDLNKAIAIDSSFFGYYFNRSSIRLELGDFHGAIKDANKALKLDAMTPPFIFGTIASAYLGLGNYTEALKYATEYIQFEEFPSSFLVRADIKFAIKDYKGALEDYQKANDPDLDRGYTYVKIAKTKFALEDNQGACIAISKALELGLKIEEDLLHKCGK